MAKRRAHLAPTPTRRPSAAYTQSDRASVRAARRRSLLLLGLVAGTIVVLGAILIVALARSGEGSTATATPIPTIQGGLPATPVPGIGVLDPSSGLAQRAPSKPKVGQPAPNFFWYTTTGRTSLAAMRGHAVLLEFFGVWCPSCQQQSQVIDSLLRTYQAQGLQAIAVTGSPYGINYESAGSQATVGIKDLTQYRDLYGAQYPLVLDPATRVFNLYGWGATFPTFYVIDAKGIVRFETDLAISSQALDAQVRAAL